MTTVEEISALTRPNHPDDWTDLDSAAVDTVRVLAADAVHKVGNGHPGTAMSLAPLAYTLFQREMRHDPSDVHWLGRDRFVLSCGHSSLTLYIQLYLGGFGLELSDIESLRTWKSKTPGHPEFRHTKGVEITTGPLGQGLASAVGMAMASRFERGLFAQREQPGRANQQSGAAERAEHDRQTTVGVGRTPAENDVVERGDGRRREAQREPVQRQMVKPPAPRRSLFLCDRAIRAAGVQMPQRQGVAQGLSERRLQPDDRTSD